MEILAFRDVQLLDIAGPLQAFASANDLAVAAGGQAPYRSRVICAAGGVVEASCGLGLAAHPLPLMGEAIDTLVVAGGHGVHAATSDPATIAWIAERATRARRVASVCTGAFLLGAAGLLSGRRVVTHWTRCAELAERHPDARVEADPIFIEDGSVWTSAGITAGIDLALALIEADLGRQAALAVARHLVVFLKRPGGQSQFSAALSLQGAEDRFGPLHAWMAENLALDLTVDRLAAEAGMSPRSFARHHRAATGQSPARALEALRLEAARRFLSDTSLPVKRIAARCGFGSEETMRCVFLRLIAVSPADYRRRFARR